MSTGSSAAWRPTAAQLEFLSEARVGRLATVDKAGRPHVLPVCFALVEDLIYSPIDEKPKRVSATALRRVRDIENNPFVCLVVDRYSEDWHDLAWVQVRAQASLLFPPDDEHVRAVVGLRRRYPQYRAMALDTLPVLRLRPERLISWGV